MVVYLSIDEIKCLSDPPWVQTYSAPTVFVWLLPKQSPFSFFNLSFAHLAPDTVEAGGRSLRDKYCRSPGLSSKRWRGRRVSVVVNIPYEYPFLVVAQLEQLRKTANRGLILLAVVYSDVLLVQTLATFSIFLIYRLCA